MRSIKAFHYIIRQAIGSFFEDVRFSFVLENILPESQNKSMTVKHSDQELLAV